MMRLPYSNERRGFSVQCNSPIRVEKHGVSENGTDDRGHNRGDFSSELVELVVLFQKATLDEKRLVLELVRRIVPPACPPKNAVFNLNADVPT